MLPHPLPDALSRAANWPPKAQAELAGYAADIESGLAAGEHICTEPALASIDRSLAAVFARYRRA